MTAQPPDNAVEATTGTPEGPGKGVAQARRDERIRGRLREAEAERDALRGRVDAMVTGEVTRLLGERVRDVPMALRAGGREAGSFVDAKTGLVDPEAVATFASEVVSVLPALHRGLPVATGETQHRVTADQLIRGRQGPSWSDLLSSSPGSTD
jgi:hypothetical protein